MDVKTLLACAATGVVASLSSVAMVTYVELQASSPGAVQTGHLNIDGTATVGKLRIGTNLNGAKVRVEDASGQGALYGKSTGTGVFGGNIAATGVAIGGEFSSTSTTGRGVYGLASASSGLTRGGLFESRSPNGVGVYGLATAPPQSYGIGVYGESKGNSGKGVVGVANTVGATVGVEGDAMSAAGTGMIANSGWKGLDATGPYFGVLATCDDTFSANVLHTAVYGTGINHGTGPSFGIYGKSNAIGGGTSYAVSGQASGGGTKWALYGYGNTGATGTKSFEIDHPFSPDTMTLRQYCAEGAEPLLVYSGNAKLDSNGKATVRLPAYVSAIGRDFRYQLTPVGAAMPGLFVASTFSDDRFTVAGGQPGGTVSWTLSAVRNDRWVQKYGAPTEVAKPTSSRGSYLEPELYGLPESRGIRVMLKPGG